MTISPVVERLGLDPSRLNHALRTALAACCAIMVAWLIGLEHPQWSGMTVWAAAQPVRGQLLEKSLFRVLGTIMGSLFGILLLILADGESWIIVIGLSLWVGLCAGMGNLLRGFVSYGVMLAGYSAAMVTLLHSAETGGTLAIGIDRMLTVMVGVMVALALGWVFAEAGNQDETSYQVRRLTRRIVDDLSATLAGTARHQHQDHHLLLAEMAAIEDRLDAHAAGSLRSREAARAIRRLLSAQVATLLWMRRPREPGGNSHLIAALHEAVTALDMPDQPERAEAALRRAAGLASGDPALAEALNGLARSMAAQTALTARGHRPVTGAFSILVLHKDWVGAREALLRAGGVTLLAGMVWLVTGWEAGSLMMLGTAIMTTAFSAAENPVHIMRYVLLGQIIGVIGALACRWLFWPMMADEFGLVIAMMPFILFGGFLAAHRYAGLVGFDYNMVLLLLLQPSWPLTTSPAASLTAAGAVLMGPLIALAAYRLIFPMDGQRRLRTLVVMMIHEIETMAARPGAFRRRSAWRARLYHRILRLVRWAERVGNNKEQLINGSFAVLMLGSAILHIDELLGKAELPPGTVRRLRVAIGRLRKLGSDPQRAADALTRLAGMPGDDLVINKALLREAAMELSNQAEFFQVKICPRQGSCKG